MPNHHRGEIAARLGGRDFTLCLTLGALAEIEAAFGVAGLDALGARLAAGGLSARDLAAILAAAARGGGHEIDAAGIAALPVAGGLAPFVDAVARLFAATFADIGSATGEGPPPPSAAAGAVGRRPEPFPWEAAMAFGLGVLRLSPEAFWRTTPRELAAAWRGVHGDGATPLGRDDLAALMRAWPDEASTSPPPRGEG